MHDENGGLGSVDPIDRAASEVIHPFGIRTPHSFAGVYQIEFVRNIACTPFGKVITDSDKHHSCSESVGVISTHPRGSVASVRSPCDSNTVLICNTHSDQMVRSIHNVIKLLAGHICLTAEGESGSSSGTASVIGVEDCIPFCRSHLARG